MFQKLILGIGLSSFLLVSCTKLDEKFNGTLTADKISTGGAGGAAGPILSGAYNSLQGTFQNQDGVYALWELTTDELALPTRGGDWDDNGVWRVLHAHQYNADNARIAGVWNNLLGATSAATDVLNFNPTPQQAAEARFLRAFAQFMVLDGWNQVPYRDPGSSPIAYPSVRKSADALAYIITELNAIIPDLPATSTADKANKNTARTLLMKCLLNKGTFANRATPTFDAADMAQVITLADQIIASNQYSFAANYFDNFAPANTTIGKENIFTQLNVGGVTSGGVRSRWHSGSHYNQQPGGWNGFTTLSDFYAKFEASDVRRGVAYPNNSPAYPNPAHKVNVGFYVGQQYDMVTGAPLKDRTGAPLAFTPDVQSVEKGANLEVTGYRVNKYAIDYVNADNGNWDNDYVVFRYADVLLMKAEAQLRTSNAAGALTIVNSLRANRGASPLAALTLDILCDERGRELYTENWRRQDLIRFGKYLLPYQLKPTDDPKYLLFPVPSGQISANPNLTQNPGF